MPRYGLATILEDHPVGHEFTIDNLPLHLTHVDSFEIELGANELAAKLSELLVHQKAFDLKALADEHYGPKKDILVTILELTAELVAFHKAIIDLLETEGAVLKNPHFNGDNFSPHISVYGLKRVKVGESVSIKDISIAAKVSEADDANRRILSNIRLLYPYSR
jgi:hypothetical protein